MIDSKIQERVYREAFDFWLGERPGADALLEWMEMMHFGDCPASAAHHLSVAGGWCKHSLNVLNNALQLCNVTAFDCVDEDEVAVAALLHDLCKIGKYRIGEDGSYYYRDERMLGHGEESVILAQRYIQLTDNETLAIRWHMGAYSGERDWKTLGLAYDRCPTALLVHFADMIAAHVDEVDDYG